MPVEEEKKKKPQQSPSPSFAAWNRKEALLSGFQVLADAADADNNNNNNKSTTSWQTAAASAVSTQLHRKRSHHTALVLSNGCILVTGGYETAAPNNNNNNNNNKRKPPTVLRSVELYDPSFQKWNKRAFPKLNQPRAEHACIQVENRLYVMGGKGPDGQILASIECLDLTTVSLGKQQQQQWVVLDTLQLSTPRYGCAAVVATTVANNNNKHVYVVGGKDANDKVVNTVDVLDTVMHKQWQGPSLHTARYGCAAVAVSFDTTTNNTNTTFYVLGGQDATGKTLASIESLSSMRAVAAGMTNKKKKKAATTTTATTSLSSWQTCPFQLQTPRMWPAVTTVKYCIFVIGGKWCRKGEGTANHASSSLNSVEVVDTKRHVVWPCASLHSTLLASTAVTISGGGGGGGGNKDDDNVYDDLLKDDAAAAAAAAGARIVVVGGCHDEKEKPIGTMQTLQLEYASHEAHIAAIENEIQYLKMNDNNINGNNNNGGRGALRKILGGGGSSSNRNKNSDESKAIAALKLYLKELKQQGSPRSGGNSTFDADGSGSAADEMENSFQDGLPSYDNGRIVAKKELKASGQARVFKGIMMMTKNNNRKQQQQEVAIKVFNSRKDWIDCKHELVTLIKISGHPNVMEVLDFFEVPMPAFIMRFISGGDLRDHLDKKGKFPSKRAISLLQGIGEGLQHLHSNNIVHRDLKSLNILLEKDKGSSVLRPVLIDLGLGTTRKNASEGAQFETRGVQGTAGWMAPEMGSSKMWSTKTDMYALGVISWEVFTGAVPYPGKTFEQVLRFVIYENGRPDHGQMKKAKVSVKHQQLIEQLWHKNPEKRPSADQFLALIASEA